MYNYLTSFMCFFWMVHISGNDAVDEDIDIGGIDHPISSFPPVEIEKDTANKNNRCSSPTSSSSDSGSSSSGWSFCQLFSFGSFLRALYCMLLTIQHACYIVERLSSYLVNTCSTFHQMLNYILDILPPNQALSRILRKLVIVVRKWLNVS